MSSIDPMASPAASNNKAKKKSKKKKANTPKPEEANGSLSANGPLDGSAETSKDDEDERADETKELISKNVPPTIDTEDSVEPRSAGEDTNTVKENGAPMESEAASLQIFSRPNNMDTEARLEAMAKERDMLRVEVRELRESLESIQEKHKTEMDGIEEKHQEEIGELQEQLDESQTGKEHAETQHRNLLGKINTIKSSLGERLKQDAEDLAHARSEIEGLEDRNQSMQREKDVLERALLQSRKEIEVHGEEIKNLRNRTNLSQQNWIKERDDLIQREAYAKEEFENAKQAMQDWEVLAMEERSLRESLGERVSELEDQLSSLQDILDRTTGERDTQSQTVDGLQRALKDIQEARKKELRELVENSQKQLDYTQKQLQAAEEASKAARKELEATTLELQRTAPFEKEVKEKSLQLGKIRHEAVILNSHLKKALKMLKKGSPEDNVDRQIVTNYFLQFLALDRADPRKFQILQVIAALLGWNDEQREQAGLSRPGASNSSLRIPLSPFRRTPSTPSLNAEAALLSESNTSRESLAELWSQFLEQEAANGSLSSPREANEIESTPQRASRSGSNAGLGIN